MSLTFPKKMSVGGISPFAHRQNPTSRKYLLTRPIRYRPPLPRPGTYKMRYNRASRFMNAYGGAGETKYIDNIPANNTGVAGASQAIPNSGLIISWWPITNGGAFQSNQSLVQIPQGTTKNTRIGNKSRVYALRARLSFKIPGGDVPDVTRCILYEDRQCNGTAATVADILEYASYNSFQAMDFVDQITILMDKTFTLNPPTSVVATETSIDYFKHIKFSYKKRHEIHFANTTGALTGVTSTNLNMLLISQANTNTQLLATATGAGASSFIRTYFKDM